MYHIIVSQTEVFMMFKSFIILLTYIYIPAHDKPEGGIQDVSKLYCTTCLYYIVMELQYSRCIIFSLYVIFAGLFVCSRFADCIDVVSIVYKESRSPSLAFWNKVPHYEIKLCLYISVSQSHLCGKKSVDPLKNLGLLQGIVTINVSFT